MELNFDEILLELSYRVPEGIVDLTKEHQVTELVNILKESGYSDANELAQKARVYFSYLQEIEEANRKKKPARQKRKATQRRTPKGPKQDINTVLAKRFINPETDREVSVQSALGYAKNTQAYNIANRMFTTAGFSDKDIDMVDAGPDDEETPIKKTNKSKSQQAPQGTKLSGDDYKLDIEKDKDKQKGRKPEQIKPEIDRISVQASESRQGFYKRGYRKAEGEDEAGAAPGNAGSMLNENGSCDVCEWALENDNTNLLDAVTHLYGNLKGGDLLEATDKSGIAGQQDRVPSISAKQLKDLRAAGKGRFDKLSDGQLSRLMVAANGGLLKAKAIKQGIKNNKWKEEDCIVNGFFGDAGGKAQQMDMVRQSNRIFAPNGREIPKEEALKLVAAGGGGANPSDTSQFVYNQKTGDLMIKFTSDKDSFEAIVAQSSFQKEGSIKKEQIDDLVKKGKLKKADGEKLKKLIDKQTTTLNKIESELKTVVAEPAKKMRSKQPEELYKLAVEFNKSGSGKARLAAIEKKYGKGGDGIKNLLKVAATNPESLSSGDRRVVDDLKKHYGLDYLVAEKIDSIRKRSIAVERKMLNEMNKIKIAISGGKVGLGDYMDAVNFVDKFHMAGALGDRHGVFAYDGLFEVVCGTGVINNNIISSCMNTNNMDDFIRKFGSTKEEFQLSKENQITGSVRIAYFLNDKGQRIRIGEKRQRSKTGAMGRFNTVYKWDKDTIECFKRKNGLA